MGLINQAKLKSVFEKLALYVNKSRLILISLQDKEILLPLLSYVD